MAIFGVLCCTAMKTESHSQKAFQSGLDGTQCVEEGTTQSVAAEDDS